MKIELYKAVPNESIKVFKRAKWDFVPPIGSIYHETGERKTYIVSAIHFTDDRIIVVIKRASKDYAELGEYLIL